MSRPVAVITGATGGMGESCASLLGKSYHLLLSDVSERKLETLAQRLRDKGSEVSTQICDLAVAEEISSLISTAIGIGRLAALVHTAALSPNMSEGSLLYQVNLLGTAMLLHAAQPYLADGAAVVCISSQAGHFAAKNSTPNIDKLIEDPLSVDFFEKIESSLENAMDPNSAYGFSKLGVIRLVQKYAPVLGAKNARIVSLSPGIIDTPMGEFEYEHQPKMKFMLDATPLKRMGRPEEIARTVRFLCSDDASFITGVDLLVDGGSTHALQRAEDGV